MVEIYCLSCNFFLIACFFLTEVDEVVLEFTINYRRKFFLYGKGIQPAIRLISARTNVRIFFPDFNPKEQSFAEAEPFTLEGRFVDVVKYENLI